MSVTKLIRIRPTAGVDSVQCWRKFLAFEAAGQTYVTVAPDDLPRLKIEKSKGWYQLDAEQADIFGAITFGTTTFLDVMTRMEAIALDAAGGEHTILSLDTQRAAEADAQRRLAVIGMTGQYAVHPAGWPLCIRDRPISETLSNL